VVGEKVNELSLLISYILSVCITITLLLVYAIAHPNSAIRLLSLLLLIAIALGWVKLLPPQQ